MEKNRRHFQVRHFVEDVALLLEEGGLPRMAGRILGWLLICDPPHQSTSQLAETLRASKGSISTMTRLLIEMDAIERVGLPGQRRDYFRLKPGGWTQMVLQDIFEISAGRELIERGLSLLEGQETEVRQRLLEARDLYVFLEREYPILIERWEKERKKSSR